MSSDSKMPKKITVIGNWKMQGSKSHVTDFLSTLKQLYNKKSENKHCKVAVCPPYVYLSQFAAELSGSQDILLGAQDVSAHAPGAYTGQIAADMLVEQGCRYVIVGHSERRQYNHETDALIAEKFFAALQVGLIPILCVGETGEQRQAGQTEAVVKSQLALVLKQGGASAFESALVAYEPVWAIGTGLTATPDQADAIHDLIRRQIGEYDPALAKRVTILYGGSVKGANAAALFGMPNIDGALVGGASLDANGFWEICQSAPIDETLSIQG